ncbi:MAG: hypothetical protein U0835_22175 [Isosphaeraceae bacterium]
MRGLDTLVKDCPGRPDYSRAQIDARIRQATLAVSLAQLDRREAGTDPARRETLLKQADDRESQAESVIRGTLQSLREMVAPDRNPEYAESLDYRRTAALNRVALGVVLLKPENDPKQAESLLNEAIELSSVLVKNDPVDYEALGLSVDAHNFLAELRSNQARYEDSVKFLLAGARALADFVVPSPTRLERAAPRPRGSWRSLRTLS